MSALGQDRAVQRVVHAQELTHRDRAATILVIVFGQQIEDVVVLTWDDVKVSDEIVTWRELAASPGNERGYSPGRPIDPGHLRCRLKKIFSRYSAPVQPDSAPYAPTSRRCETTAREDLCWVNRTARRPPP